MPPLLLEHFCQEHDEPLKLFCLGDRLPVCVVCRDLPQHRGHDFLPTKEAVQHAQVELKPYQKILKKNLKFIAVDESLQEKEIAKLESCTENILGDISRGFEILQQILREKEQNFKKVVQEMKEKNLQDMKDYLTLLKDDRTSQTETLTRVKTALVNTDHTAFLRDFKDLMDEVKKYSLEEEEEGDDDGHGDDEDDDERSGDDEEGETSDKVSADEECSDQGDYEEEEEEEDMRNVILVNPAFGEFRDSLDFKAWKEMLLKQISPGGRMKKRRDIR